MDTLHTHMNAFVAARCDELKRKYVECSKKWYDEDFMKGECVVCEGVPLAPASPQMQPPRPSFGPMPCDDEFEEYRECFMLAQHEYFQRKRDGTLGREQ